MTYVRAIVPIIVLLALSLGAAWVYRLGGQEARTELAEYKAKAAQQVAAAQAKAREAEQKHAQEMAAIGDRYEQDKRNAKQAEARTVANLRAGTERMRALWRGCEAGTSAAVADARAREREESAARIIGIGRAADDWIKRLQEVVRKDRE